MAQDIKRWSDGVEGRELAANASLAAGNAPESPWNALVRRRWLAFNVFTLLFAAGALFVLLRPPEYEAKALLMVSPREPEGVVSSQQEENFRPPDSGYVDSQVEILRSPTLAQQLVDSLDLQDDPEWAGNDGDRADVVRAVSKSIVSVRRGQTYVVEVGVTSRDPAKAARMANELVELYLASRADARIETSERTRAWLTQRLEELRADLQQREAAVEEYRARSGLLTVAGVSLTEQQLRDAETSVLASRADQAEREARLRQAQALSSRGGALDTTAGALSSNVMTELRAREADVDRRLAEYSERYGDRHPLVVAARAERADVQRQIQSEVQRLTANLGNEAEVVRARGDALAGQAERMRRDLIRNNARMVRLNELERGAAAARAVYQGFLQRNQELANGAAGVGGDAQLIASAAPPTEPASRSPMLMLGLAAALAAVAGVFSALALDRFSTRVVCAEDIERKIGQPPLTSIPALRRRDLARLKPADFHPAGYIAAHPCSAFAEALRLLRSRLAGSRFHSGVKVVAISSALPGEGKTSTALCLARLAAAASQNVLLIDCDLRGRSLNALLGIEPSVGVTEALSGKVDWRRIIGRDDASEAHILPAAGDRYSTRDHFSSDAMRNLLTELRECYDLIVLDTPPILTLAEARDIAVLADGVVVMARRGKTSISALRTALRELQAVGANVIGIALNGVDRNAPGRTSYADPLYFAHAQKHAYTN